MPTPFMHLDYAERMRSSPQLAAEVAPKLDAHWAAFCLGSVAADYQSICDVSRESTHFYPVPLLPEHDAIERLFSEHETVRDSGEISAELATFVAGYIAHLNFDLVWYRDIMLPFFAFSDKWGDASRTERFTVHNILLTYLDRQSLNDLTDRTGPMLSAAHSPTTLPFLIPEHVTRFQQMLVEQLKPGASIRTVEVYAERMGLSPDEFGQHLTDESWMQTKVFDRVPLDDVLSQLDQTVHNSAEKINAYLTG